MLDNTCTVVVAGTNELKIDACQIAIDRIHEKKPFTVLPKATGVKVPSAVFEQPIGIEESLRGATRRAEAAKKASPDATYAIGIENGIIYATEGTWIDLAVICVIAKDGRKSYSTSAGIRVTSEDVGISIATRQTRTAGSFIGARENCDPADWHNVFTGGLTSRKELLVQGVFLAMSTLFQGR